MTAFQILEMKHFMAKLLTEDCFDSFLLEKASVSCAVSYEIDGRVNPEFYQDDETPRRRLPVSALEIHPPGSVSDDPWQTHASFLQIRPASHAPVCPRRHEGRRSVFKAGTGSGAGPDHKI